MRELLAKLHHLLMSRRALCGNSCARRLGQSIRCPQQSCPPLERDICPYKRRCRLCGNTAEQEISEGNTRFERCLDMCHGAGEIPKFPNGHPKIAVDEPCAVLVACGFVLMKRGG